MRCLGTGGGSVFCLDTGAGLGEFPLTLGVEGSSRKDSIVTTRLNCGREGPVLSATVGIAFSASDLVRAALRRAGFGRGFRFCSGEGELTAGVSGAVVVAIVAELPYRLLNVRAVRAAEKQQRATQDCMRDSARFRSEETCQEWSICPMKYVDESWQELR